MIGTQDTYDTLLELHKNSRSRSYDIIVQCPYCKKDFATCKQLIQGARYFKYKAMYCSITCSNYHYRIECGHTLRKLINCKQCKKLTKMSGSSAKFCSQSCSATYNNMHKKHGIRRSKLELYIENQLTKLYPELEIHFNRKDTINSELDIYIPSLKLAFELNGIYHYEPIHGHSKLNSIQNNDNRKFQACLENGIELCIIDASALKYFKPDNAIKYLNIIVSIIKQRT